MPTFVTLSEQPSQGFAAFRNTALSATKTAVKSSMGVLFSYLFVNSNAAPVYVKFYDAASADVTVGTTTPKYVVTVPANDGTNDGVAGVSAGDIPVQFYGTAITVAVVTGIADNNTSAPAAGIYAEAQYR